MKKLLLILLIALTINGEIFDNKQKDFFENKDNLIFYADGIAKEILDKKKPVIKTKEYKEFVV